MQCCLDILKCNFLLHVLNLVKCTLKTGTRTPSYKVTKVVESKNACDVFCLDIAFDVDSNN